MRRGFTLMELLIASALFSGLLTAAYFSFVTVQRGLAGGRHTYDFMLRSTALARRLELLVAEASPYPEPGKDSHFEGDETELSFTTLRGEHAYGPPRFVSLERQGDEVRLVVSHLRWLVDDADDQSRTVVVLPGVRSLKLSYAGESGDEWKDSWNAATANELPRLVRMQLDMATEDGRRVPITVVAPTRLDRDPSIR